LNDERSSCKSKSRDGDWAAYHFPNEQLTDIVASGSYWADNAALGKLIAKRPLDYD